MVVNRFLSHPIFGRKVAPLTIIFLFFWFITLLAHAQDQLPKILSGHELEEIKNNHGIFRHMGKNYAIWALNEDEELDVLSRCRFLEKEEIQRYKAVYINTLSQTYYQTYSRENFDPSLSETEKEVLRLLTAIDFVSSVDETHHRQEESSVHILGQTSKLMFEMNSYRLFDENNSFVMNFLLLCLGPNFSSLGGKFEEGAVPDNT